LWTPPELGAVLRFEAEAEWPALAQSGGYAVPTWTHGCASNKQALVLTPDADAKEAQATITLPVPREGMKYVEIHVAGTGMNADGAVTIEGERFTWRSSPGHTCSTLPGKMIRLRGPSVTMKLEAQGGAIGIDYVAVR
jgi:hypothetical protein